MNEQQKLRDEMIRVELEKIRIANPDSVPVYFIIDEKDLSKLKDELPVMFYGKSLTVRSLVKRLNEKYPKYPFLYFFGKDHEKEREKSERSLKQKRKLKQSGGLNIQQGQKIVTLDEHHLEMSVGAAHQRYKDGNNLLVVILRATEMKIIQKRREFKEILFILLAFIFAGFYLFVALKEEKSKQQQIFTTITNKTIEM